MSTNKQPALQPLTASIKQTAERLGVSRWTVHRLINHETLRSLKIGRSRRVPYAEIDRLITEREAPTGHHKSVAT